MKLVNYLKKKYFFKILFYYIVLRFPKTFWTLRPEVNKENKLNNFFFKILKKKFNKKVFSLIELGCSNGILLKLLSKEFKLSKFTGIDLSIKNINYAKKKIKSSKIKFIRADISNFNFFKADYIVSQATLIYLNENQIFNFFNSLLKKKISKIICLELGSNSNKVVKTHFYAHPYDLILRKLKMRFKNIDYEILKLNINYWYFKNKYVSPRLIIINVKKN